MSTKTASIDADIAAFCWRPDLTIDPPLPDSKAGSVTNDYFSLKQIKDEDVQIVNGQITVVANNVTAFKPNGQPEDYLYSYPDLKKALAAVAKMAQDAGSKVNGQVVVKDNDTHRFFRLKFDNNTITVEAANLGWPDGTQTPFPEGGGA